MSEYYRLKEADIMKIMNAAQAETEDEINAKYLEFANEYGFLNMEWISKIMDYAKKNGTPDRLVEKTYYRIGEPLMDASGYFYRPSYNFADERFEDGVSVVTDGWLNSLKSVFWNAADRCKSKGIYSFRGIEIGRGGDDEPVVYPVSWATKERARSLSGLKKLVSGNH